MTRPEPPAAAGLLRRDLRLPRPAPATVAALAALVVLAAVPLLPALAGGRTLFIRDIGLVWLPQAEAFVRTVAEGAWPLWDRWSGFGRPLLADPRAGVLYPPTWLNTLLPPALFYTLHVLGHLVLSAWGSFALGRHLGLSRGGALVAAGAWVASGPLPSLSAMWHHLAGAAWMPWVVLAGERALDAPSRRRTVAWGGVLALQLFAGSPDFSLVTGGLVAAQLALRAARVRAASGLRLLGRPALLAAAFGAALSAGQWLPTLDVVSRAARLDMGEAGRTTWSLTPARLAEVALPFSWADLPLSPETLSRVLDGRAPWLFSVFLGAVGLGLAAAGAAGTGAGARRARALGAVWLIPAVLLALGRHSWVYDAVSGIPPLSLLRYPEKAMLAAAMGWSLLAGAGFQAVAAAERRPRLVGAAVLGSVALLAASAAVALWTGGFDASLSHRPGLDPAVVSRPLGARFAVSAALASAGALGCLLGRARAPQLAAALAALGAGELLWHHQRLHPTAPTALFRVEPETVDALGLPPEGRLYAYDYSQGANAEAVQRENAGAYRVARAPAGFGRAETTVLGAYTALLPPSAARWGIAGSYDLDILGFDPRPVAALANRLRALEADPEAHRRLLALGAVSRVVAIVPAPWWEALVPRAAEEGWFVLPVRVFAVPGAMPRAWAVTGVRVLDDGAAMEHLASRGFDPTREVILAGGPPRAPGPPPGRVRVTQRRGDRIELAAEMEREGTVVMADAWDPGWTASIDGAAAPVHRANVGFRAVHVPAGRHRLVLRYRPAAVVAGLGVSLLAALAAVGYAWRPAPPPRA